MLLFGVNLFTVILCTDNETHTMISLAFIATVPLRDELSLLINTHVPRCNTTTVMFSVINKY